LWFVGGSRWWSAWSGVADAAVVGWGEWVGQAAQQGAVGVEDVQDALVEAGGDASSGQVVADGVLASGEGDESGGVDEPVDLDRVPGCGRSGGDGWWSGASAAVGEQVSQVVDGEPGRDGLEAGVVEHEVDDGGVGPEADLPSRSAAVRAPRCIPCP
jgi:hypothetical protein